MSWLGIVNLDLTLIKAECLADVTFIHKFSGRLPYESATARSCWDLKPLTKKGCGLCVGRYKDINMIDLLNCANALGSSLCPLVLGKHRVLSGILMQPPRPRNDAPASGHTDRPLRAGYDQSLPRLHRIEVQKEV